MAVGNAQSVIYSALCITGSTWISEKDLKKYCQKKGLSFAQIVNASGIVQYNGHYSTKKVAQEENDIAINIMALKYMHPVKQTDDEKIEKLVHRFEEDENGGRRLHFHQVDAVKMVVNNSFSVLTGGPGTGKTTVLSAITYVLRHLNRNIEIAYTAPTGKAARRISESTGEMVTTLHKKLGITKDNSDTIIPISEDALFIDESSMNDNNLTACLSKAIKGGMRVVFVGDVDQLPSVGIGAVLRDLIASEVVSVTMLTHTFRQDNSSMLYSNICKCRKGETDFVEGPDFKPIKIQGEDINREAVMQIYNHYKQAIEEYGIDQVVVLLPYRKTGVCSNYMNNVLQKIANKRTIRYRYTNKVDNNMIDFTDIVSSTTSELCEVSASTETENFGITVLDSSIIVTYQVPFSTFFIVHVMVVLSIVTHSYFVPFGLVRDALYLPSSVVVILNVTD